MPAGYGQDYTWATALPSNQALGGSYLFRRRFCLTQDQLDVLKSPESSLSLYLAADNRGSVWLNGEQVLAEEGGTNHDMVYWNQQLPLTGSQLDLLEAGVNLLAAEVTNNRGSSDAGFDGDLRVSTTEEWPEGDDCDLPPLPGTAVSILSGLPILDAFAQTGLEYLWLSTSALPLGWTSPSFNDSSWSVGLMPAGYGPDYTWATALPSNRATGGSYLFRRRFCLTQDQLNALKSPDSLVTLYLTADDRGSVWLNGEQVLEEEGSTNHDMVYWNQQQPLTGSQLDLLEAGVNLLAVEVTNTRKSSDAGFDGDLRVSTREEWPEGDGCAPILPLQTISIISGLAVPDPPPMTGLQYLWLSTPSPPPDWTLSSFDDSSWSGGLMPAGFGPDFTWTTALPSNQATGGSYLFRRAFCLTQDQLDVLRSPESSVTLYLAADNRGSVWLNGELVLADGGWTNHEMMYWNQKEALTGWRLDLLEAGVNTLAVEVTNNAGSSDAGFDGDLRVSTREDWPEGGNCGLPSRPQVISMLTGIAISDALAKTGPDFLWMSTSSPPLGWTLPSFDDSSWSGGLMPAGYGPDYTWATPLPSNRATGGSYLFRRAFCLTQDQLDVLKSAESSVTLYLAADDRASVWLNGELVIAEEGNTNHEMVYWNQEKSLVGSQLDLLEAGVNLLTVEVTNDAGSSDAGFDGDLRVTMRGDWPEGDGCDLPSPLRTISIISGLAVPDFLAMTWLEYLWLSTSSPPPDWVSPSFDDSSWSGGLMPAGYGPDYTWATALPSNRATGGSYLFRRRFCLTQDQLDVLKSTESSVILYLAADDRGSVWLNGEQVLAEEGNTNHEMVYWNQQQSLVGSQLDLLEAGVNLLAVEVANDAGSSDAGFDGDLRVDTREDWPEGGECYLPSRPQVISILSSVAVSDILTMTGLEYLWLSASSPPLEWVSPSFDDSSWSGGLMPAGYGQDYAWVTALPSNRATGGSYLFRRRFCLTQDQLDVLKSPDSLVTLYLAADDRGSVWLNGELIFAEEGNANHEMVHWNQQEPLTGSHLDLLEAGVNLLAVEVTNDMGSFDAGFDGDLRVSTTEEWPEGDDCDLPALPQTVSLLSGLAVTGSAAMTWLKYLWLSTPSPPPDWALRSFDDISWSEGPMPAGNGPDYTWATALPSNQATGGSYLFRRRFCLAKDQLDVLKAPESSVILYLAADDRASVWLNGELIFAEAGNANHDMVHWNQQQPLTGSHLDLLEAGVNLLAVEVANDAGSSDAGFDGDLRVSATEEWPEGDDCDLPASPQTISILSGLAVTSSAAMTWLKYLWLSTSSPPPDWALRTFDDLSWAQGPMPAGYGPDYTWATALPSNRATGGSYLFRRRFCLTQDQLDVLRSPESSVTLYLAADDRGSVWLNGEQVFAEGLSTNHDMMYWNRQEDLTGSHLDLLEAGVNLLAVEVTNNGGSSDAGFDGDLRVITREEWPEGEVCDGTLPFSTSSSSIVDLASLSGLYAESMAKVELVKGHVSKVVDSLNSVSADTSFLSVYELAKSSVADALSTSVELGQTLADEAAVSAATIKEKNEEELGDILSRLNGDVSEAKIEGAVAMNAAKAAELAALARDLAESVAGAKVGTASTVMTGKRVAQLAESKLLYASIGSVSGGKAKDAVRNNVADSVSTSFELGQPLASEAAISAATIMEETDEELSDIDGAVAVTAAKAAQLAALARDFAESAMAGDAAATSTELQRSLAGDKNGIASPVMTGKPGVTHLAEIQSLKASVDSPPGGKAQEAVGNNVAEAASALQRAAAAISARKTADIAASAAFAGQSAENAALAAVRLAKKLKSNRKYLPGSTHQQITGVSNLG